QGGRGAPSRSDKGGNTIMVRTFNTLRLFVAAMALFLAVLAAPRAQAQSVKGSGTVEGITNPFLPPVFFKFSVSAKTNANGAASGKIRINGQNYSVVSLSVTGNSATVWARGKDQTVREFFFVDSGDGSVTPDTLQIQDYFFGHVISGDVTVTP